MDFGTLLYAAHKNEKTANKDVSMNDMVFGSLDNVIVLAYSFYVLNSSDFKSSGFNRTLFKFLVVSTK